MTGCHDKRNGRRPVCEACWRLVERSCHGKTRHRNESQALEVGIRYMSRTPVVYRCPICRFWHPSGDGLPADVKATMQEAAAEIVAALTPAELLILASDWAPKDDELTRADRKPKHLQHRWRKQRPLTQTLADLWPDQDRGRRRT